MRGLGVHRVAVHPREANDAIPVVERVRARYTEEEVDRIADEEAKAVLEGGVRFMNQHLHTRFPRRTVEAIKKLRTRPDYLASLGGRLAERRAVAEAGTGCQRPARTEVGALSPPPESLVDEVPRLVAGITDTMGFNGHQLVALACLLVGGEDISGALVEWLRETFPPLPPRGRRWRKWRQTGGGRLKKKLERREEYLRVQAMWKRTPGRVARWVLQGRTDRPAMPTLGEFRDYWAPILGSESVGARRRYCQPAPANPALADVMDRVISLEEVASSRVKRKTAPGPDGITPRLWWQVPPEIKCLFFNLLLMLGRVPPELSSTRTVFIPKGDSGLPGDHRPISVASVVLRQFHKILAGRVGMVGVVDDRQRAFRRADGVAEDILVLQSALWTSKRTLRSLHMASLDVSKAFDAVSRHAVVDSLRGVGAPPRFVEYVSRLYAESHTILRVGNRLSEPLPVRRGVRQGDPLSPLLFSLVLDVALRSVPEYVGFRVAGEKVNALAFADDVVLLASTEEGLQDSIDAFSRTLSKCGLFLSESKSFSMSLIALGREKKVKCVDCVFSVRGSPLPRLAVSDTWRYLGVGFQVARGVTPVPCEVGRLLRNISKAPLKPQQRLVTLVSHLVPGLLHGLIFGRVTKARLVTMDRAIRAEVRQWLHLPRDTALGYFHAPVTGGGLGIPSLSTLVPIYRSERLASLARSSWPVARACSDLELFERQRHWCRQVMGNVRTSAAAKRFFTRLLHHSVDGKELARCQDSKLSTDWVVRSSGGIPGRDYINYHRVRSGSLPSRIRLSRGERRQALDVGCRAGCGDDETAAHIVQNCWRTHGGRVHRHDAVCSMAARALMDRGWEVEREKVFAIPGIAPVDQVDGEGPKGPTQPPGLPQGPVLRRKPDIVARRDGEVLVVDAQVVSGSRDLNRTHLEKVRKYDVESLRTAIRRKYGLEDGSPVNVTALTISWKGVWSRRSVDEVSPHLSLGTLRAITTRVLWGSHKNFERFSAATGVHFRAGIG